MRAAASSAQLETRDRAFEIFLPVVKAAGAANGRLRLRGIATDESRDLDGERVRGSVLGGNLDYLLRWGKLNWNHGRDTIGEFTDCRPISKAEARARYGVDVEGRAFEVEAEVYPLGPEPETAPEDLKKARHQLLVGATLGLSIQGRRTAPQVLTAEGPETVAAFVPQIALTPQPKNLNSRATLVKSLAEIWNAETDDAPTAEESEETPLLLVLKALEVGSGSGVGASGGRAIVGEDLEGARSEARCPRGKSKAEADDQPEGEDATDGGDGLETGGDEPTSEAREEPTDAEVAADLDAAGAKDPAELAEWAKERRAEDDAGDEPGDGDAAPGDDDGKGAGQRPAREKRPMKKSIFGRLADAFRAADEEIAKGPTPEDEEGDPLRDYDDEELEPTADAAGEGISNVGVSKGVPAGAGSDEDVRLVSAEDLVKGVVTQVVSELRPVIEEIVDGRLTAFGAGQAELVKSAVAEQIQALEAEVEQKTGELEKAVEQISRTPRGARSLSGAQPVAVDAAGAGPDRSQVLGALQKGVESGEVSINDFIAFNSRGRVEFLSGKAQEYLAKAV